MGEKKFITEKDGKKREALETSCYFCNKIFLKRKQFIKEYNYCSTTCMYQSRRKRITLECSFCKSSFEKTKSSLKNSKSGLFFCSRECKDKAQKIESGFTMIHPKHYSFESSKEYRKKAFRIYPPECAGCGYNVKEVLEVHHIDENRNNNSKENLIILCRNCHKEVHIGYAKIIERKKVKVLV